MIERKLNYECFYLFLLRIALSIPSPDLNPSNANFHSKCSDCLTGQTEISLLKTSSIDAFELIWPLKKWTTCIENNWSNNELSGGRHCAFGTCLSNNIESVAVHSCIPKKTSIFFLNSPNDFARDNYLLLFALLTNWSMTRMVCIFSFIHIK